MPSALDSGVYITGVAESPLGRVTDHTELSMMAVAARAALAEAGMTLRDVDGMFVRFRTSEPYVEHTVELGEYLGIQPRFADSTDIGGCSFEAHIHHAMLAVAAGRCEVALVAYASRQRTRRARTMLAAPDDYTPLLSLPRFVTVLFPLFMCLAAVCVRRRATEPVIACSAVLVGLFTAQFATWQGNAN